MPKLGWPCSLAPPQFFPFPGSMTMTEGPTGLERCRRAVHGLSCLTSCKKTMLPMGFRGHGPEVRGSYREQLWEP